MSGLMIMGMCMSVLSSKLKARQHIFKCEACGLRCIQLIDAEGRIVVQGRGRGLEEAGGATMTAATRAGLWSGLKAALAERMIGTSHAPMPTPPDSPSDSDLISRLVSSRGEIRLTRCKGCGAVLVDFGYVEKGKPLLGRGDNFETALKDLYDHQQRLGYHPRGPGQFGLRRGDLDMCNSIFTSESVTEGHPDKVADFIADSILDAHLEQDPNSRVACEVLVKEGRVVIAGEITSSARVDVETVAREAIRAIGYTDRKEAFNTEGVKVEVLLTRQVPEIAAGVDRATDDADDQGAGDQGIMFGYATHETHEMLPRPLQLAHRLTWQMAEDRRAGRGPGSARMARPRSRSSTSRRTPFSTSGDAPAACAMWSSRPSTPGPFPSRRCEPTSAKTWFPELWARG